MSDFTVELQELLDTAYAKGQVYFTKDNFDKGEDEVDEWEEWSEPTYKRAIEEFIKEYEPR